MADNRCLHRRAQKEPGSQESRPQREAASGGGRRKIDLFALSIFSERSAAFKQ
jgi:hypothetical protein